MPTPITLTVKKDGSIECLYTEAFPLRELGKLTIARASMVEFNNETQLWEVNIDGKKIYEHDSREMCLIKERDYLS